MITPRRCPDHYGRNPHWADGELAITEVLQFLERTDRLAEVDEISTGVLLDVLGWRGTAYRSSEMIARGGRSERLTVEAGPGTRLDLHDFRHSALTHPGRRHGVNVLLLMAKPRNRKPTTSAATSKPHPRQSPS